MFLFFLVSTLDRFYWTAVRFHRICVAHRVLRPYMTANRNVLKLHERGIFENVFPEER